jgi:hypothetical protein
MGIEEEMKKTAKKTGSVGWRQIFMMHAYRNLSHDMMST